MAASKIRSRSRSSAGPCLTSSTCASHLLSHDRQTPPPPTLAATSLLPPPSCPVPISRLLMMFMLASLLLRPYSDQALPVHVAQAATLPGTMQSGGGGGGGASSLVGRGLALQKSLASDLMTRGFVGGATLLSWLLTQSSLASNKNNSTSIAVGKWLVQAMLGGGPKGVTLLVPTDATLGSAASIPPKDYMGVLKIHVLPGAMSYGQLEQLPEGTWIPTALSGSGLVVSKAGSAGDASSGGGSSSGLLLGGVPVARPNLCPSVLASFGVSCQGIGSLLDLKQAQPQPQNPSNSAFAGSMFSSPAAQPDVPPMSPLAPGSESVDSPAPSPSLMVDSPAPSPSLMVDSPAPSPSLMVDSPVPSPNIQESPAPAISSPPADTAVPVPSPSQSVVNGPPAPPADTPAPTVSEPGSSPVPANEGSSAAPSPAGGDGSAGLAAPPPSGSGSGASLSTPPGADVTGAAPPSPEAAGSGALMSGLVMAAAMASFAAMLLRLI